MHRTEIFFSSKASMGKNIRFFAMNFVLKKEFPIFFQSRFWRENYVRALLMKKIFQTDFFYWINYKFRKELLFSTIHLCASFLDFERTACVLVIDYADIRRLWEGTMPYSPCRLCLQPCGTRIFKQNKIVVPVIETLPGSHPKAIWCKLL